jgi:hypothetical protein
MTASAFSLSAAIPAAGFEVLRGDPVIGGMRDPQQRHYFCPQCMRWMYTQFLPEFVNVRATMFNDLSAIAPFIETWTKTKLPWATMPAVHSYDEFPAAEEYDTLTGEFARWLSKA